MSDSEIIVRLTAMVKRLRSTVGTNKQSQIDKLLQEVQNGEPSPKRSFMECLNQVAKDHEYHDWTDVINTLSPLKVEYLTNHLNSFITQAEDLYNIK